MFTVPRHSGLMTTRVRKFFGTAMAFSLVSSLNLNVMAANTQVESNASSKSVKLAQVDKSKKNTTTTASPDAVSTAEPIKIGFITSLTGAAAPSAQFLVNGMKLYLDQIHNTMAGRKVELIVENDESNPATAMAKYKKLAETDKVDIIAGFVLANVGYAVAPLCDKYKIPTCYVISAGDDLTQRQTHEWIVRTGWNSSLPTQPLGEYVYKTLKHKRVVTLAMDYAFGWENVGGFQKTFEGAGGKVVQKIWAPLGFTDFTKYIKEIRKDADAVFVVTFGKAAEVFPQQYKEFGPKLPMIGGGSSVDETILPKLGDEALGFVSAFPYSPVLTSPVNRKFVEAYRAKEGDDPSFYAESAYTTGIWINRAITSLKGNVSNKANVLAALKHTELTDAPRGPIKLDSQSNPIENIYVRKVQRVNGKLQNVVLYTYPAVSQFWNSKPEDFLKQPLYTKDYPPCTNCSQ